MERFEILRLLSRAAELDRFACHGFDGERRAAARVAVELGHDDARYVESLVEGVRHRHRVLSRHAVNDKQYLRRIHRRLDVHQLLHERFVDVESAGGVDDDGVEAVFQGVRHALFRDLDRAYLSHVEHFRADLFTDYAQLLYRGGTVDVRGDEQHLFALLL